MDEKLKKELLRAIEDIAKRGNVAEVKLMYGKYTVVEINRKVKYKEDAPV